jgi:cytochrome c oxidase subunit II
VKRFAAASALCLAACDGAPTFLHTSGYIGDRQATLGWILLSVAAGVVLVVSVLVVAAIFRRRPGSQDGMRAEGGLSWIYIGGIALPAVILVGISVYSLVVLAQVARPAAKPSVTIQVTGHRWWWEVRYPGSSPGDLVTTANEIHIPVGLPVRLELSTADVIHSFWIPQLAGKTDLIPGQRNVAWIEANRPGIYRGQCGEYCGLQHAKMAMALVAEPPAKFTRWLEAQRRPALDPVTEEARSGRDVFTGSACALCHTIRGTDAGGVLGPDLTHLASRGAIAAGLLRNSPGNLAGWVGNPQALKPGVAMPVVALRPDELQAVVSYLQALK